MVLFYHLSYMLGQDAQRAIKINFLLTQWNQQSKYNFFMSEISIGSIWWSNNDVINEYIEQKLT